MSTIMFTTTTAPRPTHSPSYVPRTFSRPSSPALPLPPTMARSASLPRAAGGNPPPSAAMAPTPRIDLRRGSQLKHEVVVEKKEISEGAKAILDMLSLLPAPLPATLPSKFLPTPSTSPPTTTTQSFTDYVHSRSSIKRHLSLSNPSDSDAEPESDPKASTSTASVGLGLGLSVVTPDVKKRKLSTSPPSPDKPLTPEMKRTLSAPGTGRSLTPGVEGSLRPQLRKSGLRNEVSEEGEIVEGLDETKEAWTKDQWREAALRYRSRALVLKRHGDAYQRSPSAQAQYTQILPADGLKGLLCLTDAVLLWLYAYFCEEQANGRVSSRPYSESSPLRDFVRKGWESEMRRATEDGARERAKAMVGLMHLVEAVVYYHLTSENLAHLNKRGKELTSTGGTTTASHGPSPPSTTSESPQNNPSPTSSSSPYSLPPDLLPLISTSTSNSTKAQSHLLTSRHHLPLRALRSHFPTTYSCAINSELADEALPAPGDTLGAAKKVDIDRVENFAWPIELGMISPVAHLGAFGRCLVKEMGEEGGREWKVRLE